MCICVTMYADVTNILRPENIYVSEALARFVRSRIRVVATGDPHKFSVPPPPDAPHKKNHAYIFFVVANIAREFILCASPPQKKHAYVFLKYAFKYVYLTVFMPL